MTISGTSACVKHTSPLDETDDSDAPPARKTTSSIARSIFALGSKGKSAMDNPLKALCGATVDQCLVACASITPISAPRPPRHKCLSRTSTILPALAHSTRKDSSTKCAPEIAPARNLIERLPRAPKTTCVVDGSHSCPEQRMAPRRRTSVEYFLMSTELKPLKATYALVANAGVAAFVTVGFVFGLLGAFAALATTFVVVVAVFRVVFVIESLDVDALDASRPRRSGSGAWFSTRSSCSGAKSSTGAMTGSSSLTRSSSSSSPMPLGTSWLAGRCVGSGSLGPANNS
mmetsp:Transcript_6381/g.23076  ORF Transcript_6381/g.23076 Transcript_6381/m.23076 type:complete len:288 (-) Transcript_6381:1825-2688(-)